MYRYNVILQFFSMVILTYFISWCITKGLSFTPLLFFVEKMPESYVDVVETNYWTPEGYRFIWAHCSEEDFEYWREFMIQQKYFFEHPDTVDRGEETMYFLRDITLILFVGFFIAGAIDSIEWLKANGFWHGWIDLLFG